MNRRDFLSLSAGTGAALLHRHAWAQARMHQATGLKVGEVSPDSAIVWMRLTHEAERNRTGTLRRGAPAPFPAGLRTSELEGSAPGLAGRVRVRYGTDAALRRAIETDWVEVGAETDFAHQFPLQGLEPGTRYYYTADTSDGAIHAPLRGTFRTAPPPDAATEITFAMITCQRYATLDHADGYHVYEALRRLNPDFYITAGDIVYYDTDDPRATTVELARYHWQRMYSLPRHRRLALEIPGYWAKDDHDTLANDGGEARTRPPCGR